jgi:integrase
MRKKLTSLALQAMAPGKEFVDPESGMRVRVRLTRTTFMLRYRRPVGEPDAGKSAKVVIGWFDPHRPVDLPSTLGSGMTLAQARTHYSMCRDMLARGQDPGRAKLATKRQKKAEAELNAATTFERVATQFVLKYGKARGHRRWRQQANALGIELSRAGEPTGKFKPDSLCERWRGKPLSQIGLRDIQDVCDDYLERGLPYASLSRWKICRRLFAWSKGRGLIPASPLTDAEQPFKGAHRERTLDERELRALLLACRRPEAGLFGKLMEFLIYVGCRRDEARGMLRAEVDEDGVFHIPAARYKTKQPHTIFLSRQALGILESVERVGDCPLVFTANGRTKLGGMARHKRALDTLMAEELARLGYGELVPYRIHDVRRSMATQAQKMGVPLEIIERALGHRGVTRAGIISVYQKFDFAEQQAKFWQDYADRLDLIAQGGWRWGG